MIEGNQSEVARVMRWIRDEYEAVQRVFTQSSIVSRHDFITKRQENIATHVQTLRVLVGDDQALALLRENDHQMTQEAEHDAST